MSDFYNFKDGSNIQKCNKNTKKLECSEGIKQRRKKNKKEKKHVFFYLRAI